MSLKAGTERACRLQNTLTSHMVGPHFSWLELVIRLGSALVFGSVIGAERQWRQRTAGLRTYSLVSVGAALFVLLAPLTGVQGELKEEAPCPRLCARKRSLGSAGGFPRQD